MRPSLPVAHQANTGFDGRVIINTDSTGFLLSANQLRQAPLRRWADPAISLLLNPMSHGADHEFLPQAGRRFALIQLTKPFPEEP